jgi:MoaA/NifB/PqqE/SkfB family radical SAM enzyme
MIEKVLERLRGSRKKPFAAWQIELTTRCPLQCKMCIRAESDVWQFQDMEFENFRKILPYLKDVETVVLEGWGESLLYRNLSECIRLVKGEGPQVGFVTCAKGLTKSRASDLIEAGLDFLGFSIAGTTAGIHDAIRVNSHLSEILNAVRFFNEEKTTRKLDRPKMHLVLLMLKDNISEVPQVPFLASEIGINEVVLTNICHTINLWQERQKVFIWERDENPYERFLKEAEANARKAKVKLKRPSVYAGHAAICDENPVRNLYLSVDGEVSPCVYLYPPLPSPFRRIFCGEKYWLEKVSFGNIFRESFAEIWNGESYVNFRGSFLKRQRRFRDFSFSVLDGDMGRHLKAFELPEPPGSCKTCHKILGI